MNESNRKILITGATGYVGSRLLKVLERKNYDIRCLVRKPEYLKSKIYPDTEIVQGDITNPESLESALSGIHTAFYFIHSMGSNSSFEEMDSIGAANFAEAAEKAGVRRIIYLGGLGNSEKKLSPHLRSRHETGNILRKSSVQVIEFRASVVIGAGSLSFEMIRSLVEKLPIMTTPKWVHVDTQPIAISDLLLYLEAAIHLEGNNNKIYEIGSKDIVTYGDLMQEYARQRGLKRYIIPVPVLTPWLSSLWLGLVTPLYARIGRKLIDSLKNPTVITDKSALDDFDIHPVTVAESIRRALDEEEKEFYENRWSDSLSSGNTLKTSGGTKFGTRIVYSRSLQTELSEEKAFMPIKQIGGKNGWYYANWTWKFRAYMDLLVGGVGIRRGRRDPNNIAIGDVIDWWRVEDYKPNELLRLHAEMKVPGRAWLQLEVNSKNGKTYITQTAIFDPIGLAGLIYWYILYPIHVIIFTGMLKSIENKAHEY